MFRSAGIAGSGTVWIEGAPPRDAPPPHHERPAEHHGGAGVRAGQIRQLHRPADPGDQIAGPSTMIWSKLVMGAGEIFAIIAKGLAAEEDWG